MAGVSWLDSPASVADPEDLTGVPDAELSCSRCGEMGADVRTFDGGYHGECWTLAGEPRLLHGQSAPRTAESRDDTMPPTPISAPPQIASIASSAGRANDARSRWPWILASIWLWPYIGIWAGAKRDRWLAIQACIGFAIAAGATTVVVVCALVFPSAFDSGLSASTRPSAAPEKSSGQSASGDSSQERLATEVEGRDAVQRNFGVDLYELTCSQFLQVSDGEADLAHTLLPKHGSRVLVRCRRAASDEYRVADAVTVQDVIDGW